MPADPHPSRARNPLLYLAIVAALLVSTVVYVVTRSDDGAYSTAEAFPETVITDAENAPDFDFPDALRSTDLDLNRFVDRFFRICSQGKYSEFKLMYTNRPGQEISPERFESTFNVLKSARITQLRPLPALPQFEGPTWLLVAEFDLEDYAPTQRKKGNVIRLAIGQEDDRWRLLGPVTKDALDQIEAYEAALQSKASTASSRPHP